MTYQKFSIAGTRYRRMRVLDGARHHVRFRVVDPSNVGRDRGTLHVIACRAAGYRATRRLTERRAARGEWHAVEVSRRDFTRRMLVDLEPMVLQGIVEVELDGHLIRLNPAHA